MTEERPDYDGILKENIFGTQVLTMDTPLGYYLCVAKLPLTTKAKSPRSFRDAFELATTCHLLHYRDIIPTNIMHSLPKVLARLRE